MREGDKFRKKEKGFNEIHTKTLPINNKKKRNMQHVKR